MIWYFFGICKIGLVVDENLNVYGIIGFKIVDLSVLFGNVVVNMNNMVMVVGEKVVGVIIGEFGFGF